MARSKGHAAGGRNSSGAVPPVPSDGGQGTGRFTGVDVPSAADAVVYLRRYAIDPNVLPEAGVAIAVLLDHIAKCEQTLTLIRSGHESAMKHAPEHAVIDVGKTRI